MGRRPYFVNTSPSAPFIANLFGIGANPYSRGGFMIGQGPTDRYATPIFTPESSQRISDYVNRTGDNVYTQALGGLGRGEGYAQGPKFLAEGYQRASNTIEQMLGESVPVANALIATGLPTDIGAVTNAARSRYTNEFLPQTAEQYNPSSGTGFANIALREANLMATELGQLDFSAQEAARQRQIQAMTQVVPTLSSVAAAGAALPSAYAGDLASFSQATDPGAQLMELLLALTSETYTGATPYSSGPKPPNQTMQVISGLINPLGSLLS